MAKQSQDQNPSQPSKSTAFPDWTLKKGEEKEYHVAIEQPMWKNGVGNLPPERMSKPHIVTMNAGDYKQFLQNQTRLGWVIVEVLHDPDPKVTARIAEEIEAEKAKKK